MSRTKISNATQFSLLLLMTIGCATTIRTNVTTFYITNTPLEGKTFSVFAATKEKHHTLEFASYKKNLETYLVARGMRPSKREEAELIVKFDYSVDDGFATHSSMPVYGNLPGGTTTYSGNYVGSGGTASMSGTATTSPQIGIVGSASITSREYTRTIILEIYEGKSGWAGKKLFETKAVSVGPCGDITRVIDPMLKAIFADFPGSSGVPRSVRVALPQQACHERG